jgi:DNA repair photolyase
VKKLLIAKFKGVVMAPSCHDITPANLEVSLKVLTALASNGNKLLIVSKPRIECIEPMLHDLKPWRDNVEFRFSIGCLDNELQKFWEPGAPTITERILCASHARLAGFRVSISCEPLLEPWAVFDLVSALRMAGVGEIWIGFMNKVRRRTEWALGMYANHPIANRLIGFQGLPQVQEVYDSLMGLTGIRFKDSYQRVLGIDSFGKKV